VSKLQADEISSIIKERIENFELSVDIDETGKVVSIADGIAQVFGLNNVMAGEMVEFENGERGIVLNLEEASVGVVILGKGLGVREGMSVKRLGELLKVPVGPEIVGRVVNALGDRSERVPLRRREGTGNHGQKVGSRTAADRYQSYRRARSYRKGAA